MKFKTFLIPKHEKASSVGNGKQQGKTTANIKRKLTWPRSTWTSVLATPLSLWPEHFLSWMASTRDCQNATIKRSRSISAIYPRGKAGHNFHTPEGQDPHKLALCFQQVKFIPSIFWNPGFQCNQASALVTQTKRQTKLHLSRQRFQVNLCVSSPLKKLQLLQYWQVHFGWNTATDMFSSSAQIMAAHKWSKSITHSWQKCSIQYPVLLV